ncbi:uncharacterized protein TRIVIDRAFT_226427 [Trichoderma virens Gv29-8]|uniref:Uncharacterized protein n=1 Tax=Hypocrea virens (strain Gv29-8 / FGSC 10586) TaxID=413071 RepID=G9N6W8_HYPVG|nr:uncharacterized protein TRIVIDRAFT_226427 [Trichoderma virens Gv29-8]EHK17467.1 hypothetical protein TRIVIDRAFT_226427 [Trichoderma virens Gv29-8]UKZ53813.1 hypothetical protein TrVGV298_007613 [Trichoderma virens]
MTSVEFHVQYWVLSFVSLLAQPLRPFLKELLSADDDAQGIFELAASFYSLWVILYMIEMRARALYRPEAHPPHHWIFEAGTALMCLIVGDLALWAGGVAEEGVREKLVRVLAAFIYIGAVDPVWNLRHNSNMMLFARATPKRVARNAVLSAASIGALGAAVTLVVFACTRKWLNVIEFWFGATATPHQVVVLLWLLAPFADMGETLYYLPYLLFGGYNSNNHCVWQVMAYGPLWNAMMLERLWAVFWFSTMLCGVMAYEVVSGLLGNVEASVWKSAWKNIWRWNETYLVA